MLSQPISLILLFVRKIRWIAPEEFKRLKLFFLFRGGVFKGATLEGVIDWGWLLYRSSRYRSSTLPALFGSTVYFRSWMLGFLLLKRIWVKAVYYLKYVHDCKKDVVLPWSSVKFFSENTFRGSPESHGLYSGSWLWRDQKSHAFSVFRGRGGHVRFGSAVASHSLFVRETGVCYTHFSTDDPVRLLA